MKLYYTPSVCSLAVRIILHELNISCEFEAVNLKTKQTQNGEDYLKINPKGAVPALVLDNNEILTENAVILQYLADTHKATSLLPPVEDFKRFRTLEWLNFVSMDLHRYCSPLFWSKVPEEIKQELYWPIFTKKLLVIEQHLTHNQFFMGNNFTLPDSYLFVIITWLAKLKVEMNNWPNLLRFYETMKQRVSVQSALKEEGITKAEGI